MLLRRISLLLVLLSMLTGSFLWWQRRDLRQKMNSLLAGTVSSQVFRETLPSCFFFPSARQEALAISWCLDDIETGNRLFKAITKRSSFFAPDTILNHLLDNASPEAFIAYAAFLARHDDLSPYYSVLSKQISYEAVSEAELQKGIDAIPRTAARDKIKERMGKLNQQLAEGDVPVVWDRENRVLATWSPSSRSLKEHLPGFSLEPLVPSLQTGYRQIRMTIGLDLQQHAEAHFRSYHGSLILLDLESGAILAAYSKPFSPGGSINPVLSDSYEPGSIIKLLTLFTYSGSDDRTLFPFVCQGNMTLDGKIFYDWTVHGKIETPQQAMALSCNLAFARMGLELGSEKLAQGLRSFHFNREERYGDGPFVFPMGQYRTPRDKFSLANLSIGLEEIEITTLHAALITGLIAGNGILPHPHLLASSETVLGQVVGRDHPAPMEVHARSMQYLLLQQSMAMAVDHASGTAKRAQNEKILPAVKTGTAGSSKLGLDAVIISYFPRHAPRYALAFRLERGGKAEYNGALFLNRYLTTFPR